jgi:hypothetical protein
MDDGEMLEALYFHMDDGEMLEALLISNGLVVSSDWEGRGTQVSKSEQITWGID